MQEIVWGFLTIIVECGIMFTGGDYMARKPIMVKCVYCHSDVDKSQAYKVGTRSYYCDESCFINQQNKSKQYKPPANNSDGTVNQYKLLTDKIQELYVVNGFTKKQINWTLITAQIKNLVEQQMTHAGIRLTLTYLVDIKESNLFDYETGSILNLVPFAYQEAKDFYHQKIMIAKEINSKDEDFFEDDIVYLSPHKERIWNKKYNESIEDL